MNSCCFERLIMSATYTVGCFFFQHPNKMLHRNKMPNRLTSPLFFCHLRWGARKSQSMTWKIVLGYNSMRRINTKYCVSNLYISTSYMRCYVTGVSFPLDFFDTSLSCLIKLQAGIKWTQGSEFRWAQWLGHHVKDIATITFFRINNTWRVRFYYYSKKNTRLI